MSRAVDRPRETLVIEPYVWWGPAVEGPGGEVPTCLHYVTKLLVEAMVHYHQPASRQVADIEARFTELAETWRRETTVVSSAAQMATHFAYQQIIGMGRAVLPLILRELEREPDHWFWALKAITGADPVPPQSRGRVSEMAAAWRAWAKDEGLRW